MGWVIPREHDDVIHYVKVRRPQGDPKYLAIRGSRLTLYGLDDLRGRTDAVLVEGEYDALLLRQHVGDLCGVGATGSASKGLDADAIAVLCGVRRVFVAYDTDEAGQDGAATLAGLSARVRVIPPPGGEHDITDGWKAGHDLAAWAVEHIGPDDPEKRATWLAHYLQAVGDGPLREVLQAEAERRAGEMLAETEKRTGGDAMRLIARSHDVTEVPPALADMGISKGHSASWQKVAAIPEERFERLARDRGGAWHEIPAPDWAPPDLPGGRHWYASDDDQLVSIA